ncbi:MAG: PAS domain-containing protein, partial [Eubacteriales bacterium]|nr:PAS domain-containing protein [Eubacteriales bacterium]
MDEVLYRSVFDFAPIGIAIVNDKHFVSKSRFGNDNMNPMFKKILGRTSQELADINWADITHPDDLQKDIEKFQQFKDGQIEGYSIAKRFLRPDGSYVWTHMQISHFLDLLHDDPMHLCLIEDISKEREVSDSLIESERSKAVLLSNIPGMAYRCNYDRKWTMQFVSAGSLGLTGYAPESFIDNKGIDFNDLIAPEYHELLRKEWDRVIADRVPFKGEYEIITASGERKWVIGRGQAIYDEKGDVEALEGIILDIRSEERR